MKATLDLTTTPTFKHIFLIVKVSYPSREKAGQKESVRLTQSPTPTSLRKIEICLPAGEGYDLAFRLP